MRLLCPQSHSKLAVSGQQSNAIWACRDAAAGGLIEPQGARLHLSDGDLETIAMAIGMMAAK
jgi:hypothetical protein